ncbi:MAG: extracellular solute-binding protein [Thermomicrobiales bacterium]|nr:extracellular solute-binding protein [Thermomicrobiales bacterium]
MSESSDTRYLLQSFSRDLPRRRLLQALVALGAGGSSLVAFANRLALAASDEVATLTLFSQAGVVPDVINEVALPPFNKAYPKVSVKLEVATNAVAYPKMLASRQNPVVNGGMFNDIFAQRGIKDGLWTKFVEEYVPNRQKIPGELMTPGGFGIPFHLTPFGIMYNPDRVAKPASWTDLWKPEYKGRVSMWDAYFDGYLMAAIATGKGPDPVEGIKAWAPHKQNIGEWTSSGIAQIESVHRGEVWLAPYWGGWAEQASRTGKKVAFTIPKEGAIQWTNHMQCITGFSPKVTELTQRFLDAWLSDECQLAWATRTYFGPTSKTVQIPAELRNVEALMSADEAAKKLIRYDVNTVSDRMSQLTQMINRTLKA